MSNHTPVPWRAVKNSDWRQPSHTILAGAGSFRLAEVHNDGTITREEAEANAHLIAEAPKTKEINAQLLAALKAAYELIPPPTPGSMGEERMMRTIEQVWAAIAKAEDRECTTPK